MAEKVRKNLLLPKPLIDRAEAVIADNRVLYRDFTQLTEIALLALVTQLERSKQ